MKDRTTVENKRVFYELYETGAFGNRALAWNNYDEFTKRSWPGMVCIRAKKGISRRMVRYNIKPEEVEDVLREFEESGFSRNDLAFNQSMPDSDLIIQGEVLMGLEGFNLTYTTVKKPMNLSLKEESIYTTGINAKLILQDALWHTSFLDLEELLQIYTNVGSEPSCVVEFSAYRVAVGNLPNRNTVFWEVRNY
jgi:hypothetical protein